MFQPGSPRSIGHWGADGRFAITTNSSRRRWSKGCATAPTGAICCPPRTSRRSRRRVCRPPPMSAPRSGCRNGEDDMNRFSIRGLIVLAVAATMFAGVAALGVAKLWSAQAQLPASSASTPVPVVLPRLQSVTDYVEITGNAASVNDAKLVARVEGYLEQLHYEDGAFVKKGDLLFTVQQD